MSSAVCFRSAVAMAGQYPLLAGVDLQVERGEIALLRGPNGAGKTSLLRAAAGLLPLTSGNVDVLGLDPVSDARVLRRRIGLIGHQNSLYDDLTVEDNVLFSLRAARANRASLDPALQSFGLHGRLRKVPVARLSAGQKRRVALASLIARRADLWLLDEPHAGLDADSRDLLDACIRSAAVDGATIILSSHESDRAETLGARVVKLSGGAVVTELHNTSSASGVVYVA